MEISSTRRHDSQIIHTRSEKEVFDIIGLPWVHPTLRNTDALGPNSSFLRTTLLSSCKTVVKLLYCCVFVFCALLCADYNGCILPSRHEIARDLIMLHYVNA